VPQSIFLADATIAENIAFGVPLDRIDHARVRTAARCAQIAQVIETWSDKYDTIVGERGARLSGGQRQRIGIARALYKQARVLVLDEATSALDRETERAVMDAIDAVGSGMTMLIVAHRMATLEFCTSIVEISGGTVTRSGSFQQMSAGHLPEHLQGL
jgi:ATP-binding cassette subfamily B protein